jgi:hypothetical protein
MSFWDSVEQRLDELEAGEGSTEGADDPWAGAEVGDGGLTDGQVAFLEALADQPDVPRLRAEDLDDG